MYFTQHYDHYSNSLDSYSVIVLFYYYESFKNILFTQLFYAS